MPITSINGSATQVQNNSDLLLQDRLAKAVCTISFGEDVCSPAKNPAAKTFTLPAFLRRRLQLKKSALPAKTKLISTGAIMIISFYAVQAHAAFSASFQLRVQTQF